MTKLRLLTFFSFFSTFWSFELFSMFFLNFDVLIFVVLTFSRLNYSNSGRKVHWSDTRYSDRPKPEFKPKPKYRNFGLVWAETETEISAETERLNNTETETEMHTETEISAETETETENIRSLPVIEYHTKRLRKVQASWHSFCCINWK